MGYHIHDACYELTDPSPPWGGSALPTLHCLLTGKPQPVTQSVVDVLTEGRRAVLPMDIFRQRGENGLGRLLPGKVIVQVETYPVHPWVLF